MKGVFRFINIWGYKLGKWYDMVWMEKMLGEHKVEPETFIPFSKLDYQR